MNNSPKFSLGLFFKNMNLDGIVCMQKIEDPIQVDFGLNLGIKKDLNLNIKFVLGFALKLHCGLYSDTRVSQ
jgi:hypothetical protein